MLYVRFMICLSTGLFGLSLLLKTLLDAVFLDWDLLGDMRAYFARTGRANRYMQIYDYEQETARLTTRLVPVEKAPEAKPNIFPGIWVAPQLARSKSIPAAPRS